MQCAVNDGGSGRSAHAGGDDRGNAQDISRSSKEVVDGVRRFKLDGVEIRCHHSGEGVDRRGGGLVITYAVVEVGKENSNFGDKYKTTAKVPTPAEPATAEQSTTVTTTAKGPPMAP